MTVIRKNGKAAAVFGGLAEGLGQGIALGQRTRALQQQQDRDQFDQAQALRHAQIADQELQRESQLRLAQGTAANELAQSGQPSTGDGGPFGNSKIPLVGDAQRIGNISVEDKATVDRVGAIARKMAQLGAPMHEVASFVQTAQAKHQEATDKRERNTISTHIANDAANGHLFGTQPDGVRMQSKATDEAAKGLLDSLGKGEPIEGVRAKRIALKLSVANDRTAYKHRTDTLAELDGDIATSRNVSQQGVTTPGALTGRTMQSRRLQQLRDQYEQFSDEMLHDPQSPEAHKFMQGFSKEWSQAKNGIAYEGDYGPVTFENAGAMQQAQQDVAHWKQQADQMKAAFDAARMGDLGPAAQDRRMNAEAHMMDAQRPRGPAAGNAPKDPLSFKDADAMVPSDVKGEERFNAIRDLMARAQQVTSSLKPGGPSYYGEQPSGKSKPTPEQTNAAGAGAATKLASPELRRADVLAHPEKYLRFKTKAEADAWIANGD